MASPDGESVSARLAKLLDAVERQLEAIRLHPEHLRGLGEDLRERMAHTDRKFAEVADIFAKLDADFRRRRKEANGRLE